MIAAVYARKSTDEPGKTEDAKSITRQVQRAREYATRKGWIFADEHIYSDDGISGSEFKRRPGLTKLLDALNAPRPPFGVLIISEQSRLGRDTLRTLQVIQQIEDAGVSVHAYLDDRVISVADEMGEVQGFIQSWASSAERRKASQRVRDAMRLRAEQGKSTGGRLFGYQHGKIVPAEAAIITRIFQARAAGQGYYLIARQLERDGIASPRGARGWHMSQVATILRNERYHGVVLYGKTRQVKRRGTTVTEPSPDQVIRREVSALRIIPEALWKKAQAVNDASSSRHPQGSRPTMSKWLLSPFLACGECGGSMHVRKNNRKLIYFCTNRHLLGKGKCSNARGLPIEWADRAILNRFEEALAGHLVLSTLRACLDEHERSAGDPGPVHAEVSTLRAEIARLVDALARGELSDVHDAIRARRARLEHLEGVLSGMGAAKAFDFDGFARRVKPLLKEWREHLRSNTAQAQEVIRRILPQRLKVTPTPEGGWRLSGLADYTAILKELGFDAVSRILDETRSKASRKAPPPRWPRWSRRSA